MHKHHKFSPFNLLKYIFRLILNFNMASVHRNRVSIKTMVFTLARVISKDSSLKSYKLAWVVSSSSGLLAFIVFKELFHLNMILSSTFRFNYTLVIQSFVTIVFIYVVMWLLVS